MTSIISLNTAQTTYASNLNEDDEFVWEVRELDLHNFKKVFGFEPIFEVGDQLKKVIIDIFGPESYGWSITVKEWDYDADFGGDGVVRISTIPLNPNAYKEEIFIPTPVNEYLNDAKQAGTYLDDAYTVSGSVLTMRGKGPAGDRYIMEKEYDFRGVLVSEKYLSDPDQRVIVHVEGTWVIPFGNYFFGFIAIAIVGIVSIIIRKKKFQTHY
jgi:hypothetical protein